MKLLLSTDLCTENIRSFNRGGIKMFSKIITIPDLSSANFISLMEDGYLQINGWILRPKKFLPVDDEKYSSQAFACTHILHKQDSLEYYQKLISEGWIPNIEHAKAIQSDGYKNFLPDKF